MHARDSGPHVAQGCSSSGSLLYHAPLAVVYSLACTLFGPAAPCIIIVGCRSEADEGCARCNFSLSPLRKREQLRTVVPPDRRSRFMRARSVIRLSIRSGESSTVISHRAGVGSLSVVSVNWRMFEIILTAATVMANPVKYD